MKEDPNRQSEMILRDGDAVQLAIFVLERFASSDGPLTRGDALLIAATMRILADDTTRIILMEEVRIRRAMHYGDTK